MPIAPDAPFPKTAGHIVRSKDWNDLVGEVQRLDNAKVNRAGADSIAGPLTIAGALTANSTVAIAGGLAVGGAATIMGTLWARSTLTVTGGASVGGTLAVTDAASLGDALTVAGALNVTGNVGFGVAAPLLKLEVSDRIRLRQGPNGDAGMWLYQTGVINADRAFVGMANNDEVGLFGITTGWGLRMHVATGLVVVPNSVQVSGNVQAGGRVRDAKTRQEQIANNPIARTSTSNDQFFGNMPGMSLSIVAPNGGAMYQIRFNMNGMQAQGVDRSHAEFRMLIDNGEQDYTMCEFHTGTGWSLRGVSLERLIYLAQGWHTVFIQWSVRSPDARPASSNIFGPIAAVPVSLNGCQYWDRRILTAIEL